MIKYYYLDENKNKIYYSGEVITDYTKDQIYGVLSKFKDIKKKIELEYHPEEKAVDGWSSYFTYKDINGQTQKYTGSTFNIRKSFNGSYFITKTEKIEIPVKYYPEITPVEEYFTYIDDEDNEVIYEGTKKPKYDKETNSYFIYE